MNLFFQSSNFTLIVTSSRFLRRATVQPFSAFWKVMRFPALAGMAGDGVQNRKV